MTKLIIRVCSLSFFFNKKPGIKNNVSVENELNTYNNVSYNFRLLFCTYCQTTQSGSRRIPKLKELLCL